MSNGITATQVSPIVQEDDMSKVRELFDRAANAIVQASELAKQVNELSASVDALRRDVERMRSQNEWLDSQLADTRRQRDEAIRENGTLRDTASADARTIADLRMTVDANAIKVADLSNALAHERSARDDAELHAMDLEDKLTIANATLEKIKASLGLTPPEPTPEPMAVPAPAPEPEPWQAPLTKAYW